MLEFLKTPTGLSLIIFVFCSIIIFIIRKTRTKKDDEFLDIYVEKGVEFALSVMPANTTINWIKFTKNAMVEFQKAYTSEKKMAPDASTYERAKAIIEEIAKQKASLGK
jgi:hypothetical protein